jgi:hypothetical protein
MRAIVIAFAILLFSLGVHAQACGRYHITVKVVDSASHPVQNADVKLSPIAKDETRGNQFAGDADDQSSFGIAFDEGVSLFSFHKLTVTAPGFDPADLKVTFISCQSQLLNIQLQKSGSAAKPVWQFENRLTLETEGADGQWVKNVTLKVTNADTGAAVFYQKLDLGYQSLTLPNGTYLVEFKDPTGRTQTASVDLTALQDQTVKLKF